MGTEDYYLGGGGGVDLNTHRHLVTSLKYVELYLHSCTLLHGVVLYREHRKLQISLTRQVRESQCGFQ